MNIATSPPNPRIILGLMTFGPTGTEKQGARITSTDTLNECLTYLSSKGYNEIDTARVYIDGKQEAFTAASQYRDLGFSIATKCYPHATPSHPSAKKLSHSKEGIRESLETSLKELGVDTVDIFYLHAPDRMVFWEETLQEVDKMHKEGKFVTLGLSNFTAFEVAEVSLIAREKGWVRPKIWQGMLNCITRSIEAELIPACKRYGLDIVTYNPLAGGLLSGKIKSKDLLPKEGRFSESNEATFGTYSARYLKDANFEALKLIEPVAQKHNLTLIEIALRWVRHHSPLEFEGKRRRDGIIIGVSSFDQLKSNVENLEKGPLPDEVVEVLDQAWAITKGTAPNYWHLDLKYEYDAQKALFGGK